MASVSGRQYRKEGQCTWYDYTFCTYCKLDFLLAGCHTSFSYITQLHNTDLLAVLFIRISCTLLPHFLYPSELHTVSFTPTPSPSLSYY